MAILTRHSRAQKEVVRKRGPSLCRKAQELGLKGKIRVLVIHEDPTHGVWHIAKHCPPGLTFPDIDGLVGVPKKNTCRHIANYAVGSGVRPN